MYKKLLTKFSVAKWFLLLIFHSLFYCELFSQKYNFTNYSIEQGLAQSQPGSISQDKYGMIWIATLGGISRFDGQVFYNYYTKDGLSSPLAYTLYAAKDNKIWIGTQDGIQSFDGRRFQSYSLPDNIKSKAVIDICSDTDGHVFINTGFGNLLSIQKDKAVFTKDFENVFVTSLATDRFNSIFIAAYKQGIFQLIGSHWKQTIGFNQLDSGIIIQKLFFDNQNKIWLLTDKGVYTDVNGSLANIIPHDRIKPGFLCMQEDIKGRIWIGTGKGAYIISKEGSIEYVGVDSGLTDNSVFSIIKDREGNLWFATDGDGIYKLTNSPLVYYNNTPGLHGNIVMGIVSDSQKNIWVGTSEGGLSKYDGNNFISYTIPSPQTESRKINCLFYDSGKRLWVGSIGGGLWTWEKNRFTEILTEKGNHLKDIVSIYEDSDKTIWTTMSTGLFYYNNGTLHRASTMTLPCFGVIETGKDTLLIGSSSGLWQLIGKSKLSAINIPGRAITAISCFAKWKNYILIGTNSDGIIFWNPVTNNSLQCSSKNGLASDFIFSLYSDNNSNIFTGTGNGISRINVNQEREIFTIKNYFSFNSLYGPECNLNAVQKTADGKIWFGTTRGIIVYNPSDAAETKTAPLIYLKSVELFSKKINNNIAKDSIRVWSNIPYNMKLSHRENHLTFEFTGLYYANPSNIKYRCKLEGADTGYSNLITTPKIIYSNLLPGKYRFKAIAITDSGVVSSNTIDFPFEIEAPFYQRQWFKVIAVLVLIGTGIFIQHTRNRIKIKRAAIIDKIRKEEQQKIQERTSEDLHDDLGNKITRISVLADILQNKIDKEDAEKNKLVTQIKENARLLYLGTKDIIWSLTPGNDNLYDVLERCRIFGIHLFEDTNIEFVTEGLYDRLKEIKIPLVIGRNLVMIAQEAFNNILRHSGASKAIFSIVYEKNTDVSLIISDNGKGMDQTTIGNGLGNIQKRLSRIGGSMMMNSNNPGLQLKILLKIPRKAG